MAKIATPPLPAALDNANVLLCYWNCGIQTQIIYSNIQILSIDYRVILNDLRSSQN